MRFLLAAFLAFGVSQAQAVIDVKNSNYTETWTDLVVSGTGYDMRVRRTYSSRSIYNGTFGWGWCSDFETKLDITPEGALEATECGGGLEIIYTPSGFSPRTVDNTISQLVSEVKKRNRDMTPAKLAKLKSDLQENVYLREELARRLGVSGKIVPGRVYRANGSEVEQIVLNNNVYTRTLEDGTFQKFDAKGKLTHLYDRNSNYLKIDYDKSDRIHKVTDNNGRQLVFDYKGDSRKVASINGPYKMKVVYQHKGDDLVYSKDVENQEFRYAYDDLHNMVKVTFPDKSTKELAFDKDRDWVVAFKAQDGCREKYDYQFDKKDPKNHYSAKVTKTCNGKTVVSNSYEFFHRDRPDNQGKYLHRVKSSVNGEESDTTFHQRFGRPVLVTRNGRTTKFEFYNDGLMKAKYERNREFHYEYKNSCKKVSKVTTKFYALQPVRSSKRNRRPTYKRKLVKSLFTGFQYHPKKCNLRFAKNSDGQSAKLDYDSNGRIDEITDQSKKVVKISYHSKFSKPEVVQRVGLGSIKVDYDKNGVIKDVKSNEGPRVAVQVANVFNNLLELIAPATNNEIRL